MKQFTSIGLVAVLVLSAVLLSVSSVTSAHHNPGHQQGPPAEEAKVTICHATNSATNPYTQIEVNQSAADGIAGNSGQQPDHYSEHTGPLASSEAVAQQLKSDKIDWGDIIPPIEGIHEGRNWSAQGQAMWNNNCNFVVVPEVASVTTRIVAANCEAPASLFYSLQNATLRTEVDLLAVGETEVAGPGAVSLTFDAVEGAEFENGETTLVVEVVLDDQLTGEECVLGENPVDPTTPEVLPETNGAAAALVASVVAGLTALIAVLGSSVRSLYGRSL